MASSTTSKIYIHVIEDVINKVRDEFVNNGGPGESVLDELQGIWETKMMEAEALLGPIERNSAPKATPGGPVNTPVHDLNVPYEGEEYETPTADLLFPPTPLQTPMPGTARTPLPGTALTPLSGTAQTPLPGTAQTPLTGTTDSSMFNIPTVGIPDTPNEYSSLNDATDVKTVTGRPSPYMQPPLPWLNQRPPLDVNVGRVEGEWGVSQQPLTQDFFTMPLGKRKRVGFPTRYNNGDYIPQQDGAGDALYYDSKCSLGSPFKHESVSADQEMTVKGPTASSKIPQLDGPIPDPYGDMISTPNIYNYQGVANEDYHVVDKPALDTPARTSALVPQNDRTDEDDEEQLNENDDDDLEEGEDLNTAYLVLALFDKVTRTKSRWKCTLKDGVMHINNKDILFNKATGEFEF